MFSNDQYDGPINCKAESHLEHTLLLGMERPNQAWVCTDFDVWEANPFYDGPPQPHPEDDYWMDAEVRDDRSLEEKAKVEADYEAFLDQELSQAGHTFF